MRGSYLNKNVVFLPFSLGPRRAPAGCFYNIPKRGHTPSTLGRRRDIFAGRTNRRTSGSSGCHYTNRAPCLTSAGSNGQTLAMPVTSAKGTAASGVSTCAAGQRAGRRTRPQRAASRHSACPQTLAGALCRPRRRRTPPRPPLPRGSAAFRWLLATRSSSTGRAPWSAAHPAYRRSRPSAATFAWLRPGRRAPSPRLGSPRKVDEGMRGGGEVRGRRAHVLGTR